METYMTETRRDFDWLAFSLRVIVSVSLGTWLLIERLHNHDRAGAALFAGIGYVLLPVLAYVQTRYFNTRLMFGVVEAVRRRIEKKGTA